jgi:tRNA threonylcarbamoyladenosine biosynthesis protein TsaE
MYISNSPDETAAIGQQFASKARAGDILALRGDLGTGKTQFVKGLVAGLGSTAEVTSPSFTILHEYDGGRLPTYHFDFYRLENAQAAAQIGIDDYFFNEGISVVEWADRFPDLIPERAQWISFELKSETSRVLKLEAA